MPEEMDSRNILWFVDLKQLNGAVVVRLVPRKQGTIRVRNAASHSGAGMQSYNVKLRS
jgi:hypothetical protein